MISEKAIPPFCIKFCALFNGSLYFEEKKSFIFGALFHDVIRGHVINFKKKFSLEKIWNFIKIIKTITFEAILQPKEKLWTIGRKLRYFDHRAMLITVDKKFPSLDICLEYA